MNKTMFFVSFVISIFLIDLGMSAKKQADNLRDEGPKLESSNLGMKQAIKDKGHLVRRGPVLLSTAYGLVVNHLKALENESGTNMNIQLEAGKDTDDISNHYVATEYRGIRGLKIKIVMDKFSKETDMGDVLDDIYLLEKNTDFMVSEINKDNNDLIVKGEVYGI